MVPRKDEDAEGLHTRFREDWRCHCGNSERDFLGAFQRRRKVERVLSLTVQAIFLVLYCLLCKSCLERLVLAVATLRAEFQLVHCDVVLRSRSEATNAQFKTSIVRSICQDSSTEGLQKLRNQCRHNMLD